jgi:hypothetical protein
LILINIDETSFPVNFTGLNHTAAGNVSHTGSRPTSGARWRMSGCGRAQPTTGVTGGYLLDGRAWLYAGPLVMIISIRGQVAAGNEAGLAWLLPRAETRLHHWLAGTVADGDTDDRSA